MPIYEYKCKKCDTIFEELQSINDDPLKECPTCKCEVERLISGGGGFIFKGGGFYATDYKPKTSNIKPLEKETPKTHTDKILKSAE